jgi:diguanylate cyclase (GGDEF)-like protein
VGNGPRSRNLGVPYTLDGVTASAEVFRTGRPARTGAGYASSTDPISRLMTADAWDRLERQASTDPLTGIANRRAFHERLTDEVARAERYGRHLSLALMDLDHFKAVNDAHGHQGGDRVLVLFAQLLSAHSREGELVAKIGEEEFAWLMPETDRHGAHIAADRVREAIETTPFENIGRVTLSAGVCSTESAPDVDTLTHDADRALYWAKDSGRNMTVLYTEEIPDRTAAAPGAARD